jgi:4'-phosphopantetheinyl transferase
MSEFLYWLSQRAVDVPEGDDWLSDSERSTLAGLRFAKRRSDWRLGRWTAKQAIRSYLDKGLPFSFVEIRAAEDGAPEAFSDQAPARISLSISHSNNRSLCVVGAPDQAIGCDLELLETREENLITDYFAPEEMDLCRRIQKSEKDLAVNLIWSAKESALKILREGLRRDTRSIQIDPDFKPQDGGWKRWTGRCLITSNVFSGWWCRDECHVYTLGSNGSASFPKQLRVIEP